MRHRLTPERRTTASCSRRPLPRNPSREARRGWPRRRSGTNSKAADKVLLQSSLLSGCCMRAPTRYALGRSCLRGIHVDRLLAFRGFAAALAGPVDPFPDSQCSLDYERRVGRHGYSLHLCHCRRERFAPHALARRPRPGLLLTLIPGRTPEANSPSPEYRRVHAAGASPPPYDQPHHHRTEAPAFTRRERHLHPTCGPPSRAEKPPRSRGGSLTFTLRAARPRAKKPPRSRGGSLTFTLRPAPPRSQRSPRVHAAGASPSPYEGPATIAKQPPRSRGGQSSEPRIRPVAASMRRFAEMFSIKSSSSGVLHSAAPSSRENSSSTAIFSMGSWSTVG